MKPFSHSPFSAYVALGLGIICLGFSGIFVKWANAPGAVTGFYRMVIAMLVLVAPFYRQSRSQGNKGKLSGRAIWLAFLGGLFFAGDLIFWNTGVLLSGATIPTLMGNTAPLWVGIGTWFFFRQKLPPTFWVGLLLAMVGAIIILGLDAVRNFALVPGTLFGLLAGIFYGAYFLVTQRGRQLLDSVTYFWLAAGSSALILLAAALLFGQPLTGYPLFTYLNFLGLGIVVQALGQYAFNYALGYLPASLVAPAGLGQPVMTAILAVPLLGEPLSAGQIVGGVAVLAGVFMVHRSQNRP